MDPLTGKPDEHTELSYIAIIGLTLRLLGESVFLFALWNVKSHLTDLWIVAPIARLKWLLVQGSETEMVADKR